MKGVIVSPVDMKARQGLDIRPGDIVKVHQRIVEGKDKEGKDKVRLQVFEGLVLTRKHGSEPGAMITVRKVASGVGVEKTFPLYSPMIDKIELVRRAKVRRAKLYYIRDQVARETKRKLRRLITLQGGVAESTEAAELVGATSTKEE